MKRMRQFLTGWIMLVCAISLVLPVIFSYSEDSATHDELAAEASETASPTLVTVTPDALDASVNWSVIALQQELSSETVLAICDESQSWALWPEECVTSSGKVGLAAKAIGEHEEQLSLTDACVWHLEEADEENGSWRLYVQSHDETWYLKTSGVSEEDPAGTMCSLELTSDVAEASTLVLASTSTGGYAVSVARGSTNTFLQWSEAENAFVGVKPDGEESAVLAVLEASAAVATSQEVASVASLEVLTATSNGVLAAANSAIAATSLDEDAGIAAQANDLISITPQTTDATEGWTLDEKAGSSLTDGMVIAITDSTGAYAMMPTMTSVDGCTGLQAVSVSSGQDVCVWHVEKGNDNYIRLYVLDSDGHRWYLHMEAKGGNYPGSREGLVASIYLSQSVTADAEFLASGITALAGYGAGDYGNPWWKGTYVELGSGGSFVGVVHTKDSNPYESAEQLRYWIKKEPIVVPDPIETVLPSNVTITLFDYWLEQQYTDEYLAWLASGSTEEFGGYRYYSDSTVAAAGDTNDLYKDMGINKNHALKFRKIDYSGSDALNKMMDPANRARQGIVALNLDQYPQLSGTTVTGGSSESLAYLFNEESSDYKAVYSVESGLFSLVDGYYTYDSKSNYAWYDEANKALVVYPNAAGPNGDGTTGEFLPFNTYAEAASASEPQDRINNHYMGMHMKLDFSQENGGFDTDGNASVFEFSGDDDVWIYIDDVLISDVGGVHSAVSTEIDFSAGVVTVYNDQGYDAGSVWQTTTLRDCFFSAYQEKYPDKTDAEINELLDGIFDKVTVNGATCYVFKNGTDHKLDFFWLERGNWDSNVKITFNLVTASEPAVKKVDEEGNPLAGATFQITGLSKDEETGSLVKNGSTLSGTTGTNGTWVIWDNTNHKRYTLATLKHALGDTDYFLLEEIKVPDGYGSSLTASDGAVLKIDTTSNRIIFQGLFDSDTGGLASATASYLTTIDGVDARGDITGTTVVVMNHPNTFSFTKVDELGNGLAGAVFTLTKLKDDGTAGTVLTATSSSAVDSVGLVDFGKLSLGTYKLQEASAPEGYDTITNKYWIVTVDNEGVSVLEYTLSDSGEYVASESGALASTQQWWAHLSKSTKARVTSGTGVDETVVADDEVPLADSAKTVSGATLKISNTPTPEPGSIKLIKVDATDNEGLTTANRTRLKGATFLLQKEDGNDWVDVEAKQTDDKGTIAYDNLEAGITYRITETETVDGYLLPSGDALTFTFTVNADGTITGGESTHSSLVAFSGDYDNGYTLVIGNQPNGFTLPYAGGVDRSHVVNVFLAMVLALMGVTRLCKAMSAESKA